MALFHFHSVFTSSIPSVRSHKNFANSKGLVSETQILIKPISKISENSSSASSNLIKPLLRRSNCFVSSSSSIEEDDKAPSTRIFIKGLPESTSERNLKMAFSQFGEVSRVKIMIDRQTRQSLGFGYVWFAEEESTQMAVREMNGKFFDGRFLFVTIAKPGSGKRRAKAALYKF